MEIKGLDRIDNKIINLLLENARFSFSEIGGIVGLSRTAIKNRVRVLEEKGIVSGYRAIINTQKVPQSMVFTLSIETSADNFETIVERLQERIEIVTLFQTTGKYNLTAICMAGGVEDMRYFINKIQKETTGIVMIKYNTVLDVIKGNVIPVN